MEPDHPETDPLTRALRHVGDRWTLVIVAALADGPLRFGELAESLRSIAPNVLTARLRQMDADGLVRSAPYSRRPLRFRYELTQTGRDLLGAIALLSGWGAGLGGAAPTGRALHEACGTTLEARTYCPTCERVVHEDDPADVVWT